MKISFLTMIVLVVHFVAIGAFVLMQGCGATTGRVDKTDVPMPPPITVENEQAISNALATTALDSQVKTWPVDTSIYVVKKGETLSVIASRYNLSVAEIVALNGLKNPDRIRHGQKLVLPGKIKHSTIVFSKKHKKTKQVEGEYIYIVKKGESLSEIAAEYGVKVSAIISANELKNPNFVMTGQKLIIPGVELKKKNPATLSIENDASETGIDSDPVTNEYLINKIPANNMASQYNVDKDNVIISYIVNEGDDLDSISKTYGVSMSRIKNFNNLPDSPLKPGQRLSIPVSE